ncbi:hypothetical protein ES705_41660 [subsurface metagenome]
MKRRILNILTFILMLPLMPIFGAIKIKTVEASTDKWKTRAGGAAAEYAEGAEASADLWARNAAAGADNWHLAVTAANIKTRFSRGIARAGPAKYARKIRDVAMDRFRPGIEAADIDYKAGVEPYFSTIAALTLPARKPRGDPANYNRSEAVGKALNAKRLALLGATGG